MIQYIFSYNLKMFERHWVYIDAMKDYLGVTMAKLSDQNNQNKILFVMISNQNKFLLCYDFTISVVCAD